MAWKINWYNRAGQDYGCSGGHENVVVVVVVGWKLRSTSVCCGEADGCL